MGNVRHVRQGEWHEIETSAKPVLVDFWAEWCAPCRRLAPTFERLAAEYGGRMHFAKVDVEELPEVAVQYGIRSIPTLLLLKDGKVVDELVGARPYPDLRRVLNRQLDGREATQPRLARVSKSS